MSELSEAEMTAHIRRLIVADRGAMFRMLAKTSEGRAALRKQRRVAMARLKSEKDPGEAAWAAWMLRAVDAALKPRPRAAANTRAAMPKRGAAMEKVLREARGALQVLEFSAWDARWNTAQTEDLRAAFYAVERIHSLAKDAN
ncbi:MAG: hypothetical protein KGM96_15445 [Acidobacteriota bacterium]|nr:hypothetical protein [Xanthomonadaceae bacterium]MDE3188906.1 hypothetical protein [Acidobacteriota bacterium]